MQQNGDHRPNGGYWPAKKALRPSWWTADKVLELLRNGESAPEICQRGAEEMGGKVGADRLRSDIAKWAGTLSMGEEFQAALALYKKRSDGSIIARLSEDEQAEFLTALEDANGVIEDACAACCIGIGIVEAMRDRRNKTIYSEAFADKVRVLETARMARIRGRVLRDAETGEDPNVGLKVLQTAMPSLHGPKQHIEVSGEVKHDHAHRIAREVVESSAAKVRGLMAGRDNGHTALPESRQTIDVTPRVVEKVAAEG